MKNKRLIIILGIATAILLIPFIAMQVSGNAFWSAFDFLVAAVLLVTTGLTIEFTLRKFSTNQNRLIAFGVILAVLFLVWAELAVGVFSTPLAGD